MNFFNYPFPCRSLPESDEDTKNIGFAQGIFSDGRPFHAECWAADGATHLTFFFSAIGMEDLKKEDIIKYLVSEGVIRRIEGRPCHAGIGIFVDDSKHKMFSTTITIGVEDDLFVQSEMPLHPWKQFFETDCEDLLWEDDEDIEDDIQNLTNDRVVIFSNDDEAYERYFLNNQGGYTFNFFNGPQNTRADMNVVHKANCPTLWRKKDKGNRTTRYAKVCSNNLEDFLDFVLRERGSSWHSCGICKPEIEKK